MEWFSRWFLKSSLSSLGAGILMGAWMAMVPNAIIYRPAHVHLTVAKHTPDATLIQVRAAIAAVQYTHTKRADGGKKEEQAEKAKKAAGKFAASAPPLKLVRK